MNLDTFVHTVAARELRYQRCFYMISPRPDPSMGMHFPRWTKMGIASTDLFNRLKTYRTYWPCGINVHMIVSIGQGEDSDVNELKRFEKLVIGQPWLQSQRLRNTESFLDISIDQCDHLQSIIRDHDRVLRIWRPHRCFLDRVAEFIDGVTPRKAPTSVDKDGDKHLDSLDVHIASLGRHGGREGGKSGAVSANKVV